MELTTIPEFLNDSDRNSGQKNQTKKMALKVEVFPYSAWNAFNLNSDWKNMWFHPMTKSKFYPTL